MSDLAAAYLEVQQRLIAAISAPGVDGSKPVAACPGWSVHDTYAHLVGVVADVASGDLGELGPLSSDLLDQWRNTDVQHARDAMTARQARERGPVELALITDEWVDATNAVLPMLRGDAPVPPGLPSFIPFVLINDLVVHEIDIRAALDLPRPADSPALSLALASYAFSLEHRLRTLGLPGLTLDADGKERTVGDTPTAATLTASRHELVRCLAGRRTAAQIADLDWRGDPTPYLDVLPEYGPTTTHGVD